MKPQEPIKEKRVNVRGSRKKEGMQSDTCSKQMGTKYPNIRNVRRKKLLLVKRGLRCEGSMPSEIFPLHTCAQTSLVKEFRPSNASSVSPAPKSPCTCARVQETFHAHFQSAFLLHEKRGVKGD